MSSTIFLRYITQNIIGMIGLSCYILVDTWFVSLALGTNGLAALNLAITVFSVVSGAGQLLGVGGGTDFAIRRAEGRDAGHSLSTSLVIGGRLSLLFAGTGLFLSGPLTRFLGADKATFALTEIYVRVTLLFAPVYMLGAILQGFVRNDGSPNLAMLSMLVSSALNIVLDYLFMFPLKMGMFGAVLATGLSALLSTPVLLSHFFTKHCTLLPLRAPHALPDALKALSYGLSALIGELASAVSLLTFNLLLMHLSGAVGVAAYGVIANAALVATAIFTGLGQGVQPLASQEFGMHDQSGLKRLLGYIRNTVAILSIAIFSAAFLFAQPIASAFNHERDMLLQAMAETGLRVYFAGYLFAGVNIAACAFLSAVNEAKLALMISLLRSCVLLIPAAIALSALFNTMGVWLAFTMTEAACCVISLISIKKAA
ncbi:MAG: MATE family efflux transporter [Clostridia bacterium]|nr:MATE family efflux transporter [Clostridia bacterium]